jgi:hypothetical protein
MPNAVAAPLVQLANYTAANAISPAILRYIREV